MRLRVRKARPLVNEAEVKLAFISVLPWRRHARCLRESGESVVLATFSLRQAKLSHIHKHGYISHA